MFFKEKIKILDYFNILLKQSLKDCLGFNNKDIELFSNLQVTDGWVLLNILILFYELLPYLLKANSFEKIARAFMTI